MDNLFKDYRWICSASPTTVTCNIENVEGSFSSKTSTQLTATIEIRKASFSAFDSSDPREGGLEIQSSPIKSNGSNSSIKKPRSKSKKGVGNTAMHDPEFLRKRTADLLRITALEHGKQATVVGKHMKVDKKTFHFLLDAWAFSGEIDAADQALKLLDRMEDLGGTLQPDVRSYTKTINAIGRVAAFDAGERADQLLATMKQLYDENRSSNTHLAEQIKPNSYTYTAVVQAHAKLWSTRCRRTC